MKIITNDATYVQKRDIEYLYLAHEKIPSSIFVKVFGSGLIRIDNTNRNDFVKFEDEVERDFFNNLDFIIDYNEVKDLSETDIKKLFQAIDDEQFMVATKMNDVRGKNDIDALAHLTRYNQLDYKFSSLRVAFGFKTGYFVFDLPKELENLEAKEIDAVKKLNLKKD